ncbi:MAG: DUF3238 domain-containing protein [Pseudomonadota bacterium]
MLTVWIASFIPKEIQGYTRQVPGGGGATMIPGPTPLNDCFHTDQRSFSEQANASSRMRTEVRISLNDFSLSSQRHTCDATIECDCEDGDVECNEEANRSNLKVKNYLSNGSGCTFLIEGGAGNPCVLAGAPEINWKILVAVKRNAEGNIEVMIESGSVVEPFPAFEMYASLSGRTQRIFATSPDDGSNPWDLYGPPNKQVTGSAVFQ